jgi:hypothetical protein
VAKVEIALIKAERGKLLLGGRTFSIEPSDQGWILLKPLPQLSDCGGDLTMCPEGF